MKATAANLNLQQNILGRIYKVDYSWLIWICSGVSFKKKIFGCYNQAVITCIESINSVKTFNHGLIEIYPVDWATIIYQVDS